MTADLSTTVVFHVGRRNGDPTIGESRLALRFMLPYVWTDGFESTRQTYELKRPPLLHACWFAATYGIDGYRFKKNKRVLTGKKWIRRWGSWAAQWEDEMWTGLWDEVPDPPDQEAAV